MKKNNLLPYLAIVVLFALFNLITFLVPNDKTVMFWTAYGFTVAVFAVQVVLWRIEIDGKNTLKSKLLGIPIVQVGISYLILQIIAFVVFTVFPDIPIKVTIIVCSIILALFVLCVIAGQAGVNEIDRVEEKVKVKRYFIQSLQVDIEMLAESEKDTETKKALLSLAEKVRFSDPMSHEMLAELESRISANVDEMKTAADKRILIGEIGALLTERNKKCKILK